MEAAEPIQGETPPEKNFDNINFIEEKIIKNENEDFKIHFGIKQNELIIRITSEKIKELFYYQKAYIMKELYNISKIFSTYKNAEDMIINFFKQLNFEIEKKAEDIMIIKFNAFTPIGQNELIKLELKKIYQDKKHIINYFSEEIKPIKKDIEKIKQKVENLEKGIKEEIEKLKEQDKQIKTKIPNNNFNEKESLVIICSIIIISIISALFVYNNNI